MRWAFIHFLQRGRRLLAHRRRFLLGLDASGLWGAAVISQPSRIFKEVPLEMDVDPPIEQALFFSNLALATDQFFSPPTFSTNIERISNEAFIDISGADCPDASNWPTFWPSSKVQPRQGQPACRQHQPAFASPTLSESAPARCGRRAGLQQSCSSPMAVF
jgi:hypothetical protein